MKVKKALTLILLFNIIFLSTSTRIWAKEKDKYQQIVDKYNIIYNVSLICNSVSEDMDINDFEKVISDLAKQERATLDYIQARENDCMEPSISSKDIMVSTSKKFSTSSVSWHKVTDTKQALTASYLDPSAYTITCTYKAYTNPDGNPVNTVGNAENVSTNVSSNVLIMRAYSLNRWSQRNLDAGRTLGIETSGTVKHNYLLTGQYLEVSNVTVYAEFRYK